MQPLPSNSSPGKTRFIPLGRCRPFHQIPPLRWHIFIQQMNHCWEQASLDIGIHDVLQQLKYGRIFHWEYWVHWRVVLAPPFSAGTRCAACSEQYFDTVWSTVKVLQQVLPSHRAPAYPVLNVHTEVSSERSLTVFEYLQWCSIWILRSCESDAHFMQIKTGCFSQGCSIPLLRATCCWLFLAVWHCRKHSPHLQNICGTFLGVKMTTWQHGHVSTQADVHACLTHGITWHVQRYKIVTTVQFGTVYKEVCGYPRQLTLAWLWNLCFTARMLVSRWA